MCFELGGRSDMVIAIPLGAAAAARWDAAAESVWAALNADDDAASALLQEVSVKQAGRRINRLQTRALCCKGLKYTCKRVRALLSLLRQITLAEDCRGKRVRAEIQSLTRKPLQ